MPQPSGAKSQKIVTCLWFASEGDEATRFYRSVFKDSKLVNESRWGPGGMGPEGSLIAATVELAGVQLMVLNGNPRPGFTDAASLCVHCDTQAEIDDLWTKLTAGGEEVQCGWLKDRFGVSWQIVPSALGAMLGDPDPAKAARVTAAMLKMKKLDLARLQQARDKR